MKQLVLNYLSLNAVLFPRRIFSGTANILKKKLAADLREKLSLQNIFGGDDNLVYRGIIIYVIKNTDGINIYSYNEFLEEKINKLGLNLVTVNAEYSPQIMVEEFINLVSRETALDVELL